MLNHALGTYNDEGRPSCEVSICVRLTLIAFKMIDSVMFDKLVYITSTQNIHCRKWKFLLPPAVDMWVAKIYVRIEVKLCTRIRGQLFL